MNYEGKKNIRMEPQYINCILESLTVCVFDEGVVFHYGLHTFARILFKGSTLTHSSITELLYAVSRTCHVIHSHQCRPLRSIDQGVKQFHRVQLRAGISSDTYLLSTNSYFLVYNVVVVSSQFLENLISVLDRIVIELYREVEFCHVFDPQIVAENVINAFPSFFMHYLVVRFPYEPIWIVRIQILL